MAKQTTVSMMSTGESERPMKAKGEKKCPTCDQPWSECKAECGKPGPDCMCDDSGKETDGEVD